MVLLSRTDETERSNGDDGWDMDDIPLGDGQVSSPEPAAAQSSSSPLRSQRPAADKLSGDAQLQTRIAALEKVETLCIKEILSADSRQTLNSRDMESVHMEWSGHVQAFRSRPGNRQLQTCVLASLFRG